MLAYIFPGQGSQYVGMGKDLAAADARARALFERADAALGVALSTICFDGPDNDLKQTVNTQPAIFVHSMAMLALLDAAPAMVAGHSLGEYSALVAANVLAFEDAVRLVRLRGELMQQCGTEHPGTMAAVIGMDDAVLESVCADARAAGIVQPANYNSPGQIVISGSVDGVREAMRIAKERGARMVKELNVSGAFHSPLMEPAQDGLRTAIAGVTFRDATIPVYANVTAAPVQDAGEIKDLLVRQLTNPVRWSESVRAMAANGGTDFLEVGPGSVLQGLVKRIATGVTTRGADKWTDIHPA